MDFLICGFASKMGLGLSKNDWLVLAVDFKTDMEIIAF